MYVLVTKNNKNLTINVYLFSYKNMLKLYFNKHLIYIYIKHLLVKSVIKWLFYYYTNSQALGCVPVLVVAV